MIGAAIDIFRARQDTPGCEKVLHFNNAGVALMPRPVLEAITEYQQLEAESGLYKAWELAQADAEHVYEAASELIGCQRDEIAIVENMKSAWEMAFYSLPWKSSDRILTNVAYSSNIVFLHIAQKTGAKVEIIPDDCCGQVSVAALQDLLNADVKLIAITHVPTNSGLINPIMEIKEIARQAGVLFLLDVCQSIGQMPVQVSSIGCDILSTSGCRYLRGPRGTGFLYVRRELLEQLKPPYPTPKWASKGRYEIWDYARRIENWGAIRVGKRIGLGVAIDYALSWGLDAIWARISSLAGTLRNRLSQIPQVSVRDLGQQKCGIVTFTLDARESQDIRRQLAEQDINVSVSMDNRGLARVVRASVHYYNTEEEIDRFCNSVNEC